MSLPRGGESVVVTAGGGDLFPNQPHQQQHHRQQQQQQHRQSEHSHLSSRPSTNADKDLDFGRTKVGSDNDSDN